MKMHVVLHALCIYSCHSRSEARLSDVTSITREQTCRDTVSCEDAQADATRMALGEGVTVSRVSRRQNTRFCGVTFGGSTVFLTPPTQDVGARQARTRRGLTCATT